MCNAERVRIGEGYQMDDSSWRHALLEEVRRACGPPIHGGG
jgi:hypothetical protein